MMSEQRFNVILRCEQINKTQQDFEYFVEIDGTEKALKDILKENVEQQATITSLQEENKALKKFIKDNFSEMMDSKRVIDDERSRIEN